MPGRKSGTELSAMTAEEEHVHPLRAQSGPMLTVGAASLGAQGVFPFAIKHPLIGSNPYLDCEAWFPT